MFPFAQPAVINAGVSGDNAAGGHSRLARDVLFARPDLVFVNFGLNDSMNPDVEDGLRRYREAMKGIFEDVRSSGAECVLVTPNHMCGYVSHRLENDTLRDIARDAARVQNEGILRRYVDAAREEARAQGVRSPIHTACGTRLPPRASTPPRCSPTASTILPAKRIGFS